MDHFATLVFVANLRLRVQVDNLQHLKAARLASNSRLGANLRHLRAVNWQPTLSLLLNKCSIMMEHATCGSWEAVFGNLKIASKSQLSEKRHSSALVFGV